MIHFELIFIYVTRYELRFSFCIRISSDLHLEKAREEGHMQSRSLHDGMVGCARDQKPQEESWEGGDLGTALSRQ